ncbi:MAG: hypothetical protein JST01_16430 [Cyanobacteria bacterium SZAS TMP-1]|nr:hypothetical protein [Cyanobacteria bacterium SZAS TMP-1]
MHKVFSMVQTPRALFEAMPGDDCAFVGIAAADGTWYLRFYANWDAEDRELIGRFDLTLPSNIAKEFEETVLKSSGMVMQRQDAEAYFETKNR